MIKKLNERLSNTFKFSNNNINKFKVFILMVHWEKFNEVTLPEKEEFLAT